MLGQAGVVVLAIFCYFQVRGLAHAHRAEAVAHARDLQAFERRWGIDLESAVQAPLLRWSWLETAANWIYIWGHWPVIIATLLWLVRRHRVQFLRLRDAMIVSGGLGLVIFLTYPVAPPRLAVPGLVDTVTEGSESYRVLQPPMFVNQYAAMPSLHVGWDLLVGISIATAATSVALRVVGVLLPVLMAWAVVATANHYVVDVVAGITLALVGYAAALLLQRRRERRGAEP